MYAETLPHIVACLRLDAGRALLVFTRPHRRTTTLTTVSLSRQQAVSSLRLRSRPAMSPSWLSRRFKTAASRQPQRLAQPIDRRCAPALRIRSLALADCQAVFRLIESCDDDWAADFAAGRAPAGYVACVDNTIIGALWYRLGPKSTPGQALHRGVVEVLAVSEQWRSEGAGTLLWEELIKRYPMVRWKLMSDVPTSNQWFRKKRRGCSSDSEVENPYKGRYPSEYLRKRPQQ